MIENHSPILEGSSTIPTTLADNIYAVYNKYALYPVDLSLLHTLWHPIEGGVISVQLSLDGKWLATGGYRVMQVFEVENGRRKAIFADLQGDSVGFISTLNFSPDARYLMGGGSEGIIWICNIGTGGMRKDAVLTDHQDGFLYTFARNTMRLAACLKNGPIEGRDVIVHDLEDTISFHEFGFNPRDSAIFRDSIALSPDGNFIAMGGGPGKISIWESYTGRHIREIDAATRSSIQHLDFSPTGDKLMSIYFANFLTVWDVSALSGGLPSDDDNVQRKQQFWHFPNIHRAAWCADGTGIIGGGVDGYIEAWDSDGQLKFMLKAHGISHVDCYPRSKLQIS